MSADPELMANRILDKIMDMVDDDGRLSLDTLPIIEKYIIQYGNERVIDFYSHVCDQAEKNMLITGKLEGSHYAAMRKEIQKMASADSNRERA